jgi:phage-related protein
MATFDYCPNPDANKRVSPRTIGIQFGDGYSQRVADGINTQARVWDLTFTRLKDTIDEIEDFFIARNGVESFDWVPPEGDQGKFVCSSWARALPYKGVHSISAQFIEVFGE